MIATNSQTTASIKREATELMDKLEFPNNITPKKKPWFAQKALINYDAKFDKLGFRYFCNYYKVNQHTAQIRKDAMESNSCIKKGRPNILNSEDNEKLMEWFASNCGNNKGVTLVDIQNQALHILRLRAVKEGEKAPEELSDSWVRRWIENSNLVLKKKLSSYEAASLIPRCHVVAFFDQYDTLVNEHHYKPYLIFNMDESWVANEGKQNTEKVVTYKNSLPIFHQKKDGKHMTLLGCITQNGVRFPTVYILPSELKQQKYLDEYGLNDVHYYVSSSGFINTTILVSWINDYLVPYVNSKRRNSAERALLLLDSHKTRNTEDVKIALASANIDMLLIPPHTTSILQPLDVGIYSSYKHYLRGKTGNSGIYASVQHSEDGFYRAATITNVQNAWKQAGYTDLQRRKEVIDSFPENRGTIIVGNNAYL